MSRSKRCSGVRRNSGFTLVEVLVALVVVSVSLAAIGSLMGASIRGTRSLDQRIALIETARSVMTGLPDREQLVPGSFSGEMAGHRWRVDVLPFAADFIDRRQQLRWIPQTVTITVQSPVGQSVQLSTIRLRRNEQAPANAPAESSRP